MQNRALTISASSALFPYLAASVVLAALASSVLRAPWTNLLSEARRKLDLFG